MFFDVEGPGLVADGSCMVGRPTVVLIHGGPGADHSVFTPWLSPLADVAQLVYLDLRGSGRSDEGDPSVSSLRATLVPIGGRRIVVRSSRGGGGGGGRALVEELVSSLELVGRSGGGFG